MVLPGSLGAKDMRKAFRRQRKEPQRTPTVLMEESKEAIDSSYQPPAGSIQSKKTVLEPIAEPVDSREFHTVQPHLSQISNSQNSLYAAALLGLAMTTRGEIGFLIAAVAQSAGVIEPSDVYVVIIWGIALCTLLGPIGVGIFTRKLERKGTADGQRTILGKWG